MKKSNFRIIKGKGPVKNLDRSKKALKIYSILEDEHQKPLSRLTVLDIGCGNGLICKQFADKNTVYGVDINDFRKFKKFTFNKVSSAKLPHKDNFFDIVISNHTIEHIPNQSLHLTEMHRVLKPGGILYLATPNKTSPFMQGHIGNQLVLPWRKMQKLFANHGFDSKLKSIEVIKHPDRFHVKSGPLQRMPSKILRLLCFLMPSHIFILSKSVSLK